MRARTVCIIPIHTHITSMCMHVYMYIDTCVQGEGRAARTFGARGGRYRAALSWRQCYRPLARIYIHAHVYPSPSLRYQGRTHATVVCLRHGSAVRTRMCVYVHVYMMHVCMRRAVFWLHEACHLLWRKRERERVVCLFVWMWCMCECVCVIVRAREREVTYPKEN